jgi:hypothetical protein
MGDFSLQDTIGAALGAWSQREQAKIDSRLIESREQVFAYEQAARSSNTQAYGGGSMPQWLPLVGFGLLGLVVYMAVK